MESGTASGYEILDLKPEAYNIARQAGVNPQPLGLVRAMDMATKIRRSLPAQPQLPGHGGTRTLQMFATESWFS